MQAYSTKDDGNTEPEEDHSSYTEEKDLGITARGGYRDC